MVASHYSEQLSPADILRRVKTAFPDGALPHQLAGIDQLHIGGLKASEKLLGNLETDPGVPYEILEIGAGLGGLQRLCICRLPEHPALHYTTLDITPGFSLLNRELNSLCLSPNKASRASVLTGDGQQLAMADKQFDAVILQHSLLNMPASQRCLSECYRVLKPGGKLILHEVLRGDLQQAVTYPVPWASDDTHSHLISPATLIRQLKTAGLQIISQQDWSAEALEWRQQQSRKETEIKATPARLSPTEIFGERFMQMAANLLASLLSGAIQVHEIIAEKKP